MNKGFDDEFIQQYMDQVQKLAQLGCTNKEISDVIGVCEKSLNTHWRRQLDLGRGKLKSSLRKTQIEVALRDRNTQMLIWLGKQYLHQCEPKQQMEHSGGLSIQRVVYGASESSNTDS